MKLGFYQDNQNRAVKLTRIAGGDKGKVCYFNHANKPYDLELPLSEFKEHYKKVKSGYVSAAKQLHAKLKLDDAEITLKAINLETKANHAKAALLVSICRCMGLFVITIEGKIVNKGSKLIK